MYRFKVSRPNAQREMKNLIYQGHNAGVIGITLKALRPVVFN